MPFNPYNPYNPYAPQPNFGNFLQQSQQNTYAFVNGIEGARSFQMAPNQTVMLMDSDNPVVYMKQSNGMGQSTIKCFKLVETSEDELKPKPIQADYVTKADFESLAKKVDALLKKE